MCPVLLYTWNVKPDAEYSLQVLWLVFFHTHLFFTHIYFPTSGQQAVVTGVVPSPRFFHFLSRIGSSNPTARRFSSSVANSSPRAFRMPICAQEKVPTPLYEYALGGIRTHETDLYQAR